MPGFSRVNALLGDGPVLPFHLGQIPNVGNMSKCAQTGFACLIRRILSLFVLNCLPTGLSEELAPWYGTRYDVRPEDVIQSEFQIILC